MCTIGLDLHKRESQLCIRTPEGEMVERRNATTRARFTEVVARQALPQFARGGFTKFGCSSAGRRATRIGGGS